jgi:hypothetical protein
MRRILCLLRNLPICMQFDVDPGFSGSIRGLSKESLRDFSVGVYGFQVTIDRFELVLEM